MALELRNGVYYVRTMVDGRRVQKSTRTGDLKVAKAIHQKILGELLLDCHGVTKRKLPTLREAFEQAMRTHYAGQKSKVTNVTRFKALEEYLGNPNLADISSHMVQTMAGDMLADEYAPSTVNRTISLLSTILTLNEVELKMPHFKEYKGRIRYLSKTDEEALWKALEVRMGGDQGETVWEPLRCLLVVLMDTGIRLGEALRMQPEDIVVDRADLHVWISKGDLSRTLPLTDRALKAAVGVPWASLTKDMVEHRFKSLRTAAGLDEEVVIHTLRHTCATRLAQSGLNVAQIQQWMGHKDIKTTMRYVHLASQDLHGCRDALQVYQSSTND